MRRFRLSALLVLTALIAYLSAFFSSTDGRAADIVLQTGFTVFAILVVLGASGFLTEMLKSLRPPHSPASNQGQSDEA